jgi:hypothetical protein
MNRWHALSPLILSFFACQHESMTCFFTLSFFFFFFLFLVNEIIHFSIHIQHRERSWAPANTVGFVSLRENTLIGCFFFFLFYYYLLHYCMSTWKAYLQISNACSCFISLIIYFFFAWSSEYIIIVYIL